MKKPGDQTAATRSALGAELPDLQQGQVRVLDGPSAGATLILQRSQPKTVGTSSRCDLVLEDSTVSRRHAELMPGRHGFLVKDLGSRNGTYFEGSRIGTLAVPSGAIVRVGRTHLVLSALDEPGATARKGLGKLVGASPPMQRVYSALARAAASDVTVLLQGETGVGKELAAQVIHEQSARAAHPLEVFDCSGASAELIQAGLFGHVRGAFTGAVAERPGVFERAEGGTVLLDNVSELPLELQPVLLRVCDSKQVTRVGGLSAKKVSVRLIATSHVDLAREVVAGRFREDLYYRLAVVSIELPRLEDRLEDLPALCQDLLAELGVSRPGPIDGPRLEFLRRRPWPGNVRELRNLLERAVVLGGRSVGFRAMALELSAHQAGATGPQTAGASFQKRKAEVVEAFERQFLVALMAEHRDNIKAASRGSGIERTQLKRLLRKHRLLPA